MKSGFAMLEEQRQRQVALDAAEAIDTLECVIEDLAEFARGDHSLGSQGANEARISQLEDRATDALALLLESVSR